MDYPEVSVQNLTHYKLRHQDLQQSIFLKIREQFLMLIQRNNKSFKLVTNSAGLPMLCCVENENDNTEPLITPNNVIHCTVYDHPHLNYFIRLMFNENVYENIERLPKSQKHKHTYNKYVYIYHGDVVQILVPYYEEEDFIKEIKKIPFNMPTDIAKIVYSYLYD